MTIVSQPATWGGAFTTVATFPDVPPVAERLSLSACDTSRFHAASHALLTFSECSTPDEWRRNVNRAVRELLSADTATFVLDMPGSTPVFSEELPPTILNELPQRFALLDRRWSLWDRAAVLGVWNRPLLYGSHLGAFLQSEYYNDYVVPCRLFDTLSMTVRVPQQGGVLASVGVHYERPSRRPFERRGMQLLRLLLPTFQTAVRLYPRLLAQHRALEHALDSFSEGVLVGDLAGRIVHTTPSLNRLLESEPESSRVIAEAQHIARRVAAVRTAPDSMVTESPVGTYVHEVSTERARYRLRGCLYDGDFLGHSRAIIVMVSRMTPELPCATELREAYGLSTKEARVCLLLAGGRSNDEIAGLLNISVHTARHHTEQVLCRLNVHSRAQVAPRLLGGISK